jgi:hypothetical protein
LDPSIGSTIDFFYNVGSPAGCRDLRTFGPGDVTGRYLVNVLIQQDGSPSVCIGAPQCTVTVNPATLPASCSTPVTPIVDPVTPTGDVPVDGNTDGDYCDPEDGPFAEGQILGNQSTSQASCEAYASPGPPATGSHISLVRGSATTCSLFSDFGYTPGGACEIEIETFCSIVETTGFECESKVAAFDLIYTGPEILGADVEVFGKDQGETILSGIDLIPGTIVSVDGRPGDLGAKTTITINGEAEVIHTSCSRQSEGRSVLELARCRLRRQEWPRLLDRGNRAGERLYDHRPVEERRQEKEVFCFDRQLE